MVPENIHTHPHGRTLEIQRGWGYKKPLKGKYGAKLEGWWGGELK